MCHPLSQDVCTSLGCVQELNREAGQLSHGASEETTGTYKRGSEVRGRAGQSTQKGKAMKNWGKLWVIFCLTEYWYGYNPDYFIIRSTS